MDIKAHFAYELSVPEYRKIEAMARFTFLYKDNAALERERMLLFRRLIALESEQERRKREYQQMIRGVQKHAQTM
ncbi:hypothetical protein P0082_01010 [Candidatus Haliotispira prima]|uniref:Uncharacterized protein n=1 Tax=Candidatus Haliotispira prima TaxID=3034016 RepID=A0ABY8MHU6_9SPIO|nr:hypothetical protein P0082_01010 [Candidatus Haliotispira prima]